MTLLTQSRCLLYPSVPSRLSHCAGGDQRCGKDRLNHTESRQVGLGSGKDSWKNMLVWKDISRQKLACWVMGRSFLHFFVKKKNPCLTWLRGKLPRRKMKQGSATWPLLDLLYTPQLLTMPKPGCSSRLGEIC